MFVILPTLTLERFFPSARRYGGVNNQPACKILSSVLARDDITFMAPTPEILRSHFFHLLWAEFPQPSPPAAAAAATAVVPGQMTVENVYPRGSL